MNWYGPTGDCGCCDPCPVFVECAGGEQRERTPRQITFVLENLPDVIYYRNTTSPQGYAVSGSNFTPYYIFARYGNIKSLEGTYTLNLQDTPQLPPAGKPVLCSYTRIDFSPSITVQAEITPDKFGCPSTLISRSIVSLSTVFSMVALFNGLSFGPYFPLGVSCYFGASFTLAASGSPSYDDYVFFYSFGASWVISERVIGGYFDGTKYCGFRNGNLERIAASEVTDCAAYGPQPDDDSTWQYD